MRCHTAMILAQPRDTYATLARIALNSFWQCSHTPLCDVRSPKRLQSLIVDMLDRQAHVLQSLRQTLMRRLRCFHRKNSPLDLATKHNGALHLRLLAYVREAPPLTFESEIPRWPLEADNEVGICE